MATQDSMTLVYARHDREQDWKRLGTARKIITVRNFNVLAAAISIAVSEKVADVRQVIFDRTIGSEKFLQLLSALPTEFLGDVLAVFEDGGGYLSAITRQEGRVIYRLEPGDVDFYLELHLGM